ncbi:MAG: hypothetical protein DKINENOH_00497 [bacterium]|nr:hypothetical protein [bacterium]
MAGASAAGAQCPVDHEFIGCGRSCRRAGTGLLRRRKGLVQLERRLAMRGFLPVAGGLAQLEIALHRGKICQKNAVGPEHAPDFSEQAAAAGGAIEIEQAEDTEYRVKAFLLKTESQKIALRQPRPRINKGFFCANVKHWPAQVNAHTGLPRHRGDFRQHGAGAAARLQNAARRRQQLIERALNQTGPRRIVDQIIEIVVERRKGVIELAEVLGFGDGGIGHHHGESKTGRRGGERGRAVAPANGPSLSCKTRLIPWCHPVGIL